MPPHLAPGWVGLRPRPDGRRGLAFPEPCLGEIIWEDREKALGDTVPWEGLQVTCHTSRPTKANPSVGAASGMELGLMEPSWVLCTFVPGGARRLEGLSHLNFCLSGFLCLVPGQDSHLEAR